MALFWLGGGTSLAVAGAGQGHGEMGVESGVREDVGGLILVQRVMGEKEASRPKSSKVWIRDVSCQPLFPLCVAVDGADYVQSDYSRKWHRELLW